MKNLDYNKIMCVIGILLITVFCGVVIKDYNTYDIFNNSAPFHILILIRVIEFWLPGIILVYLYNENTSLKQTKYLVKSKKLPKSFNGYKIAHISDFHNTNSKRIKEKLIKSLVTIKPGIIVVTGDLIDSRRTNIQSAKKFFSRLTKIAPVYYVLGNHESRLYDVQKLINEVQGVGVNVLRNIRVTLTNQDENVEIWGIDDPAFFVPLENACDIFKKTDEVLQTIVKDNNYYKILLIHRPELLDIYSKHGFDLVFTGHAHGGQICLPLIGGMMAPGQGLLPKYTKGIYKANNTQMVVSRGIGNSKFPFRFNNKPELVIVTLMSEDKK